MEFIKGMDISMVKELEYYGASYRLNGKEEDLFHLLHECGTNMVRIRIGLIHMMKRAILMEAEEMTCRPPSKLQEEQWNVAWTLCWIFIIVISGQIQPSR